MKYLTFNRNVSRESVERLLRDLCCLNAPQQVLVDSPGGKFEFFQVLGPALERRGLVTLSGDVRSAAIILFLLGHRRQAFPDATFYFHETYVLPELAGGVTIGDLGDMLEYEKRASAQGREILEEARRQMVLARNWLMFFLREKTGLSTESLCNLMANEVTLDAKSALRYGIVHEILPSSMREP